MAALESKAGIVRVLPSRAPGGGAGADEGLGMGVSGVAPLSVKLAPDMEGAAVTEEAADGAGGEQKEDNMDGSKALAELKERVDALEKQLKEQQVSITKIAPYVESLVSIPYMDVCIITCTWLHARQAGWHKMPCMQPSTTGGCNSKIVG